MKHGLDIGFRRQRTGHSGSKSREGIETDTLEEETDDRGRQYVGSHELRRTQATQLRSADVDAMVVCDRGGSGFK